MTMSGSTHAVEHGVRDGRVAPVTCAACGCRLTLDGSSDGEARWYHYSSLGGRDARGCTVGCVDLPHDREGQPVRVN